MKFKNIYQILLLSFVVFNIENKCSFSEQKLPTQYEYLQQRKFYYYIIKITTFTNISYLQESI